MARCQSRTEYMEKEQNLSEATQGAKAYSKHYE